MKLISFVFRHFIPISLVGLVGAFLVSASAPVTATRITGVGIDLLSSPPLTPQAVEEELDAIQQAGSDYVRIEVSWTLIEATADEYNWSNVLPLDLFFGAAQARGIKSVAVITGLPLYLASTDGGLDQKTVGLRWEKFIQAAVDHFGSQVDYWQIGDQINSSNGNRSLAQADPAFYAKMLRSAYKLIKKADLNDQVWMGSLVSATAETCALNPMTFMLEINAAKAWDASDALTYQPRRGAALPENGAASAINPACASSMAANYPSLGAEVGAVQELARQLTGKPIYITGMAWSTDELMLLRENRSMDLYTLHSDLLVRGSAALMGNNVIQLVFWQVDQMIQASAFNSAANMQQIVENAKPLGQIQGQSGATHEYRFQKGAITSTVIWRSQDGDSAQVVTLSGWDAKSLNAYAADAANLDSSSAVAVPINSDGIAVMQLNERPVLLTVKNGGWDDQLTSSARDQLDQWRIDIQKALSNGLNQLKAAFLQWLEGLFSKAKDSAIDWGEEQIKNIFN